MVNHDIVPGITVRFRDTKEHLDYRDHHRIAATFIVTGVNDKYVYWEEGDRRRSCYLRRVEPADGPW